MEAIEIFKATAQKLGKSGLLLFETVEIVYTILQCSLLTVLGLRYKQRWFPLFFAQIFCRIPHILILDFWILNI